MVAGHSLVPRSLSPPGLWEWTTMQMELDQQVPEARDVEVRPVREDALPERDQPRPTGVEILVGVVDGLGQRGHGGNPPGRQGGRVANSGRSQ
jgi:hypothetical protein